MPAIKNWNTGETILEYQGDLRTALVEAVQQGKLLSGSDLSGSDLSGSDLSGSNLRYSNLSGSNLSGSNLSSSNLSGSDLSGSDLRYSDLRGSDLRYSDLRGSDLRGSDLSGSNLRGSDLRGSDLSGSNLSGSDLRGHPIVVGGLRSDGYQFMLTNFAEQGIRILAGCRNFDPAEAREHWTRKSGQLGVESLAILDHLLNLARIRGIVPEQPEQPITVTRTPNRSAVAPDRGREKVMVSDRELRILIESARACGAIIKTKVDRSDVITDVQVCKGIPGVGPGWMPVIQAAERLGEFLGLTRNL